MSIGKLKPVELRKLWIHEEYDSSRWLENNVDVLSEALGLALTVEESEKSAGLYRADLIAKDVNGNRVIIENQLDPAYLDHLGQIVNLSRKSRLKSGRMDC